MEDTYRLIGEFTLKCAALEATTDEFLFQGADHFGRKFAQRVGKRPRNINDRGDALVALMQDFIRFNIPIEKSVFVDFESFTQFMKEIAQLRNAIFHSSLFEILGAQGRSTFVFSRIGMESEKEESARNFKRHMEKYSKKQINDAICKLDHAQILVECGIAALAWETPGWNEMEIHRKARVPFVYDSLRIGDRVMSLSRAENPFEGLEIA